MTRQELFAIHLAALRTAGIEGPERDLRLMMAHSASADRAKLGAIMNEVPSNNEADELARLVRARCARQPLSHIVGYRDFWEHRFTVSPDVLDPRPESEALVDIALSGPPPVRVLDLGTGSGCLLISILLAVPRAVGVGVDISPAALGVANDNVERHGVGHRVTLESGSWFETVSGVFDLIVSNPPYIPDQDIETLGPEVREWEPRLALSGGADGLDAYRHIATGAQSVLSPGGRVLLECGRGQTEDVAELLRQAQFQQIRIHADLGGVPRCVEAYGPTV